MRSALSNTLKILLYIFLPLSMTTSLASQSNKSQQAQDNEVNYKQGLAFEKEGTASSLKQAFELYKIAGNKGHVDAMNRAGILSAREFEGHSAKPTTALAWFEAAAKKGHGEAMYNLGNLLLEKFTTHPHSKEEAINWFREAAAAGYRPAIDKLINLGIVTPEMMSQAKLLEERFNNIPAGAMFRKAILLEERDHNNIPTKKKDAFEWYSRALSKERNPKTMFNMGLLAEMDLEGIPANKNTALYWFEEAAKSGLALAMNKMGTLYEEQLACLSKETTDPLLIQKARDLIQKAQGWFEKAAQHPDQSEENKPYIIDGMILLGQLWTTDFPGRQADDARAIEWFEKAAKLESGSEGMLSSGMLRAGNLLMRNGVIDKSLVWLTEAAKKGNEFAMFNLGIYHLNFLDSKEGIGWLLESSAKGLTTAMIELAKVHMGYYGEGIFDLNKALFWLSKAEALGDARAKQYFTILEQRKSDTKAQVAVEVDRLLESTEGQLTGKTSTPTVCPTSEHKGEAKGASVSPSPGLVKEAPVKERVQKHALVPAQEASPKAERTVPKVKKRGLANPTATLAQINQMQAQKKQAVAARAPLSTKSQALVHQIMTALDINEKDIINLFQDPYFANEVQVYNTANGLMVSCHNLQTNQQKTISTHEKHPQDRKKAKSKSQYDPAFIKDLREILRIFKLG